MSMAAMPVLENSVFILTTNGLLPHLAVRFFIATNIGTPGGYYVGTREFARDNPELVRVILEEIDKNGQWAEANRKEVAKLIAPVLKIDLPIQEVISERANYRLKGITPELMKAQQNVADLFYNEKILLT